MIYAFDGEQSLVLVAHLDLTTRCHVRNSNWAGRPTHTVPHRPIAPVVRSAFNVCRTGFG